MDCEKIYSLIVSEAKAFFEKAGFSKAVLGLSGGIDSALVSFVLVDALGKENVTCLLMPDNNKSSLQDHKNVTCLLMPDNNKSSLQDHKDALNLVKQLGMAFYEIPLDNAVSAVENSLKWKQSRIAKMNIGARLRMVFLYNFANSLDALVVGTGNKSELLLGYFTKHGDGASDFFPLQNLFKTDVFKLAEHRGLPKKLIDKKPSAGLVPNQTDEGELGAKYGQIDLFLKEFEKGAGEKELKQAFPAELVDSLIKRINANKHKR